jgi:hypothetical protein
MLIDGIFVVFFVLGPVALFALLRLREDLRDRVYVPLHIRDFVL